MVVVGSRLKQLKVKIECEGCRCVLDGSGRT